MSNPHPILPVTSSPYNPVIYNESSYRNPRDQNQGQNCIHSKGFLNENTLNFRFHRREDDQEIYSNASQQNSLPLSNRNWQKQGQKNTNIERRINGAYREMNGQSTLKEQRKTEQFWREKENQSRNVRDGSGYESSNGDVRQESHKRNRDAFTSSNSISNKEDSSEKGSKTNKCRKLNNSSSDKEPFIDLLAHRNIEITEAAKMENIDRALAIFEEMKANGLCPTQLNYTLLLQLSVKMENVDAACALYKEMNAKKMNCELATCDSFFSLLEKKEDEKRAYDLFEANQIPLNKKTYLLLFKLFVKNKNVLAAGALFEDMKTKEMFPDETVYESLINLFVKLKYPKNAYILLKEMKTMNFPPLKNRTYNSLLNLFIQKEYVKGARSVYKEIQTKEVPCRGRTFISLLNLYLKNEYSVIAFNLFKDMRRRKIVGVKEGLEGLQIKPRPDLSLLLKNM